MADSGIELTDLLGPAAKFLAKTGAIEKLVMSLSEEERGKFFAALSSKLCLFCGRVGSPPDCRCESARTKKR